MRYTIARPLACVAVAAMALAGEPAAAQISHQGQNISDHVVLRDGSLSGRGLPVCPPTASFKDKALFRVFPDGTRAAEPFTVPPGRLLVVTDVEWTVNALSGGPSLTAGATVRTRVSIGSDMTFDQVFLSRTVEVGSERGYVSGNEQLTTGFVVAPNTTICADSAEFGSNAVKSARLIELVLRGYLINTQ
jgi:hypothetical protein